MIRAALADTLAPSPWVERAEARQSGLDRTLLHAYGVLMAAASPLRRQRLRAFARHVLMTDALLQAESIKQL